MTEKAIKVNLGCGHIQPEGWVNVDGSNRAWLAHYLPWIDRPLTKMKIFPPTEFSTRTTIMNLAKPLKFKTDSVNAIYCGELLEHFTPADMRKFLRECVRSLAPGGVFRATVPDIHSFWRGYCNEVDAMVKRSRAEWDDKSIRHKVEVFFADICVNRPWLGSMNHFHKWGYDEVQMILEFERAGLVDVSRRAYLDSAIEGINQVETRVSGFLIVEGRKPAKSA